ncbi:lanthionine synthetase C family protein [Halobacteriovorax sp. GFR7]|uniref:lanthionine synthetase C family protein n=1 Tax=unclassified Halobacteriovorax TaxID=2639665 RepID=UPI003D960F34
MNIDKSRHTKLIASEWDEAKARYAIEEIYKSAVKDIDVNSEYKGLYMGSGGVLWGLLSIARFLGRNVDLDLESTATEIYRNYLNKPDNDKITPSLPMGEVGLLLLRYRINESKELEDEIYELVESNIENPTLEFLWGAPGTMLAASFFYDKTKSERWKRLYLENANFLIAKLKERSDEELIWEQDMYGKKVTYVGAGHGYFGNIYSILRSKELLSEADQKFILDHTKDVAKKLAVYDEEGHVNWRPTHPDIPQAPTLVQWCHGSPGIITSLKYYPKYEGDEDIEELLVKAGELTWKAGPLNKGIGICHGTDGNGLAFLQLYKRTGDQIWLNRARAYAMHELSSANYKESELNLFTGKLGFALFLIACIEETDNFPLIDEL